jgi:glycosyltransferase involved in cell wall biosynthesis
MGNLSHEATSTRIAWVSPSMKFGFYVQPVLRNFKQLFPETTVFTGDWPGFIKGCENTFYVNVVGKNRELVIHKTNTGYNRIIQLLSLNLIPSLYKFKPKVVFVVGFSLWTFISVILKFLGWRTVIIYDGSSPNIDVNDSFIRLSSRRMMAKLADAFLTNSFAGKAYLVKVLQTEESKVFAQPYQVPDKQSLIAVQENTEWNNLNYKQPTFLFIGQTIHRKGITFLLKACLLLKQQGCTDYTLIVIGDGEQRHEYENWIKTHDLDNQVKFEGWVSYEKLGAYFENTDIFIFPTLEDIWGMVVLEAMLFGKPILCSKFAGVAEIIRPEENGHLFDPYNPQEIAQLIRHFIDNPHLINSMGAKSQEIIAKYTPETAAKLLAEVTSFVLEGR